MKSILIGSLIIISGVSICLIYLNGKVIEGKKIIYTDKAPKPIGPYSQAVMQGNLLFVSGQIAINPNTNLLDTSSIENETRQVMENINAVLLAAGTNMANILKCTIYLSDISKFKMMNEI